MAAQSHLETRFDRVDKKLNELSQVFVLLARIEERLIAQTQRSEVLAERMDSLDMRVSALELSRAKFMGAVMVVSGLGSCAWPIVQKLFIGA